MTYVFVTLYYSIKNIKLWHLLTFSEKHTMCFHTVFAMTNWKNVCFVNNVFFLSMFAGKPSLIQHRNHSTLRGIYLAISSARHTSVESEQLLRQKTISRACMVDMPKPVKMRFIVDYRWNVGICIVNKAGSTTLRYLMLLVKGVVSPHHVHRYDSMQGLDLGAEHVATSHNNTTFKTIMFVRNPISRLISAYKSKFCRRKFNHVKRTVGRQIIKTFRENATKESLARVHDVTFQEFVKHIISMEKTPSKMDAHWRPQYLICNPCQIKFDFVGKTETFNNDATHVMRYFYDFEMDSIPQRNTASNFNVNLSLPKQDIMKLLEIYRKDFLHFGYPMQWPR